MADRVWPIAALAGVVMAVHVLLLGAWPAPPQRLTPPALRVRVSEAPPRSWPRDARMPEAVKPLPAVVSAPLPALPAAAPAYWPSEQLDRRPVPISAPDTRRLDGIVLSGLPLRLRLLIDAGGRVIDVQPLSVAPGDEAALLRLRDMFIATAFIPGRLDGRDVASRLDLELSAESAAGGG